MNTWFRTDSSRRPARISATPALAVVLAFALTACGDLGQDSPVAPETTSERLGVPVPPGLQDFGPAIAAADRHTEALMRNPHVVGTAVGLNDDGRPAVRLFLASDQARGLPEHLDGVPVSPVVTGQFHVRRADRTARARPAPIGFSVGHPDITAGTIGARVTDGTNVFILSNNHVLANRNNAQIGDAALQPGAVDGGNEPGDVIGTLYDYEPIDYNSTNEMDAAIALVDAADVSGSTPAGVSYGAPSNQVVDPSVGMAVQKYGRTTGHTTGTVSETNVTVSVCFVARGPFMCAQSATFVGQFTVTDGSFSSGGDSGSLIVRQGGNEAVGLLFAGSSTRTVANPIGPILDRFGVSIDDTVPDDDSGEPGEPEGPTASFTYACDGLTCHFDASGSGAGDADITSYEWTFGDGNTGSGQAVSHEYANDGTYTVTLEVTDADGLSDTDTRSVTVAGEGDDPGPGELSIDQLDVSTRATGPLASGHRDLERLAHRGRARRCDHGAPGR
jgi:PKD repeat protein